MGTEEFWVPAVIAAAGSGAQYVNEKNANNRAQDVETANIMQQQGKQEQAAAGANKLTAQIGADNPNTLKSQAVGTYVQALRRNAAGSTGGGSTTSNKNLDGASVSALPSVVNGSDRYKQGLADSQTEVQNYGGNLADELGTIDSGVRQRQNEGLAMQDYATQLNGLNQQSWGTNFVNQLRAQQEGQANPWVSLAAGLAQKYGTTAAGKGMAGGFNGGAAQNSFVNGATNAAGYTNASGVLQPW